ncbi:MAG: basic rane lipoprotein [Chloroflexi bacterium]|nr:basic rane lipoprotein [Chloroflexota bacterium]
MKKISTILVVLMIAAMLLSACAQATPAPTAAPVEPTAAPVEPTAAPVEPTAVPPTEVPPTEVPPTEVPPTEAAPAEAFKVGFVTDTGGISDGSFNETQWNGVVAGCKEYGCEPKYIVSNEAADYEPNLTEFAGQGYQLVQAAGFFLGGAVAKVAVQYPDVKFTIFDYSYPNSFDVPEGQIGNKECIPNVEGQIFKTDQASFLAGYLAAGMTKTGKIGTFGGAKIPTVTIFAVGFQKGMELYNQVHGTDVKLVGWDSATGEGIFTGDFQDQVKGKEATQSLFDEGADIFMPVGGQIGIPGFEVARERGGYGIWVDTDGYVTLPGVQDVILTSVMKVMDVAATSVIKDVKEGNFKGCSNYVGDMPNAGVGLAPYHDVASKVPADLQAEIEGLKAKIISGEITDTGCLSAPDWCPSGLYTTP